MSLSLKHRIAELPAAQRARWFTKLPDPMKKSIVMGTAWWFEGRPEQQPPPGLWRFWVVLAGRGWGKTRVGAEWSADKARRYPGARIALVAPTFADGRDTMVEGVSGLLSVLHPSELRGGSVESAWNRSMGELFLANGSQFKVFSSERPMRLRGPQHHFCFPAGTMIRTPDAQVPIELLDVGDLVETRQGPRRIIKTGSRNAEVLTLHHEHGSLTGTADHPIWVMDYGWVPLAKVPITGRLMLWTDDRSPDPKTVSGPSARPVTGTAIQTTPSSTDTARCGSSSTGRSRRRLTFITRTTSKVTTTSATLNCSLPASMGPSTHTSPALFSAKLAMPISRLRFMARRADSATTAVRSGVGPHRFAVVRWRGNAGGSPSNGPANTAEGVSCPNGVVGSAVSGVSTSAHATRVYNLTVEGEHEYFANNVLVHNCWADEPSYWLDVEAGTAKDSTFSNLNIGLRNPPIPGWERGYRPQGIFTTTPRRVPLLKMPDDLVKERPELAGLMQRKDVLITTGSTMDNIDNLDESYKEAVIDPLIGTTLGAQELGGIMLEDVEGALWTMAQIAADRVEVAPRLDRVVVSFDPSGGAGYGHDEHGIMVLGSAGARRDQRFYLLADRSGNCTPNAAAERAIFAWLEFGAAKIVYEKNQGQDWIPAVFQAVWEKLTTKDPKTGKVPLPEYEGQTAPPLQFVDAVKSKRDRATPVAMLAQQHRIHHVGVYPILENQQTSWLPDEGLASPDRLDAFVHGIKWLREHGLGVADVASAAQRETRARQSGGRRGAATAARMPAAYGSGRVR